jgi:malate/lactate dehydrogenase
MKITIIGAGALGSHLVQALRNEQVTLKIIDFDA